MWYGRKGKKQVPLGVTDPHDEAAAWAAFQALMHQARQEAAAQPQTIAQAVGAFLADAAGRVKARTLKGYKWYLGQFLARFGTLQLATVTAEQIEKDARRSKWSSTTRNNYLCTVETCLRAAGLKLQFKKPPKESAGAGSVIPESVYRHILAHCSGDWYKVICFLWHTGCRPSEAAAVTAESVDWENGVVRLKDHKTARHGKGDRIIYLNPQAAEVLAWQRDRHGSGFLFRGQTGKPFSTQAFVQKFCRISKRVGHHVTAYGFRHTFATRALANGESDSIVAALLGHSGTQMIHRHYAHTSAMGRQLKDAADRISKPGRESA